MFIQANIACYTFTTRKLNLMSPRGKKRLAEAEPATQSVRARLEAEEGRDDSDEEN